MKSLHAALGEQVPYNEIPEHFLRPEAETLEPMVIISLLRDLQDPAHNNLKLDLTSPILYHRKNSGVHGKMEKLAANYLRIRRNGQITLPAEIRRKAGGQEGDLFEGIAESNGSIHLLPKTQPDRKLAEKYQMKDIRWARKQKMVK